MYYTPTMQSAVFEAEKNRKAFIYTVIICVTILLLAFLISWPVFKVAPLPVSQDLMEIDLGAAEGPIQETMGGGGSPAPAAVQPINKHNDEEDAAQQDADDDNNQEAAPVIRNPRPSPSKNVATKPVIQPAPVVKKPAIVMPSNRTGTNPGTSNTDDFGRGPGKGPGTGPGVGPGNGGGAGGSSVVKGVKPLNLGSLRFEDDFSENAKVYLDVRYNNTGAFTSATVVKPTTTTNSTILRIARQKVSALKFPATDDGGITTILLNFKVN